MLPRELEGCGAEVAPELVEGPRPDHRHGAVRARPRDGDLIGAQPQNGTMIEASMLLTML
jgi:hypothetical protein